METPRTSKGTPCKLCKAKGDLCHLHSRNVERRKSNLSDAGRKDLFQLCNIRGENYQYTSQRYSALDIVLNRDQAKVYINETYPVLFGRTVFFESWTQSQGNLILTVDMENYETSWNLESLYFLPHLKLYKNVLFYDLLSGKEREHFRGLGRHVFRLLVSHIMTVNEGISDDTPITMGATDVKKMGKGNLASLVKFYEELSFEVDYTEYDRFVKENNYDRRVTSETLGFEIKNVGKSGFLKYVPMITTFGNIRHGEGTKNEKADKGAANNKEA